MMFRAPHADFTLPLSVNDQETTVGEYWYPLRSYMRSGWERQRSFLRHPDGRFDTFAIPVEHADNQVVITNALSINKLNKVVGQWRLMTVPENIEGQVHSFLYDNGQFTELLVPGTGADTYALYINNHDQVLVWSNGFWLEDDGRFYRVNEPEGYRISWIEGMDDFGRLAASIVKLATNCPNNICPPQRFNAILTPR
jgi:hypothetical protein